MKSYEIVFSVPDDFDPEEMILNVQYKDGDIAIEDEGFIDELVPASILEQVDDFLNNDLRLIKDTVNEGDIVRMIFTPEAAQLPFFDKILVSLKEAIEATYKVPCIAHMNNIDVLVENADEAINMLNGMIAKIRTRAAVKDTSGIILPS